MHAEAVVSAVRAQRRYGAGLVIVVALRAVPALVWAGGYAADGPRDAQALDQRQEAGPGLIAAAIDVPAFDEAARTSRLMLGNVDLGDGGVVTLDLARFEVFAPGARVAVGGPAGETAIERPAVALFRGTVAGEPDSFAFLSVAPHGVNGVIERGGRTFVIASGPAGRHGEPIVVDLATLPEEMFDPDGYRCRADELPALWSPPPGPISTPRTAPPCRVAQLAIETDWEFTGNLFGGDTAAAGAYAATLIGAVSAIFTRDLNVRLEISYLRLWDNSADPWDQADTGAQLTQFRDYWNANMTGVHRHLAHFLSGRGLGGGVAWVGVVCYPTYDYALSANLGGYFPYPLEHNSGANWDLMVTAHELGHNFGAPHTHDMTPPVDGCASGNCSVTPNGTIMSYCHLCPGGLANVRMELHERTINEAILPYLVTPGVCSLTDAPLAGNALHFDGANDYVNVPGFGSIAPTTEVTVEFWQYADDVAGRSSFGMNPDQATNRFQAHVPWSNGAVYWDFGNINTGGRLSYTPPVSITGSWQHFAFVASQSGNTMRIYRNGVLEAQKAGMRAFSRGAFDLRLGSLGGGNFFNGRLDEVRIWSVARSAAEIAAKYNTTLVGNEPGLVAYWRCDEGTGTSLDDLAGANNGALVGASWAANTMCAGDSGSCCYPDGTCLQVTESACAALSGVYSGDGTSCELDPCPQPGACCISGEDTCAFVLPADCAALGGTYRGAGTTCDGIGPFNSFALEFDGADDYVALDEPPVLNFAGAITIEAWIRPDAIDGKRNIVMHGHTSTTNLECGLRINEGRYAIISRSGSFHNASAPIPASDIGQWVHLVGTHDGTAWRLYRNGVLISESIDSVGASAFGAKWAIGSRGTGTERFFRGGITDVRIWNVARTAAEIDAYHHRRLTGSEPGLVGYWQLNEGAGTTAIDRASGNNGVLNGPNWRETNRCNTEAPSDVRPAR